jgi:hypothetical protein
MKELLQQMAAFLWHVIDAPETSPDTRQAAEVLVEEVVDAINEFPSDYGLDESPQD